MSQPTNLYDRYDGTKAVREELANVIYNISPEDTVFMSSVGRENVKNTFFEWQTDAIASASTANAVIEGDEATLDAQVPTNRVGNYTQISRKVVGVSGTIEAVDNAGFKSALAYNMAKAAAELKTDMEARMLYNGVAVVGNSSTARQTAGLPTWLKYNYNRAGAGTTLPNYSSTNDGYPSTAWGSSTARTFSETILKDVIQQVWAAGGDPKICMMGPHNKTVASTFTGIAQHRVNMTNSNAGPLTSIATVDVYQSDFGKVSFVANRFQPENYAFVVDPEYASVAYLRNFSTTDLSVTGDSKKKMLLVEWGLKVKSPKAHGIATDLETS
jgi:hypothetical protein